MNDRELVALGLEHHRQELQQREEEFHPAGKKKRQNGDRRQTQNPQSFVSPSLWIITKMMVAIQER